MAAVPKEQEKESPVQWFTIAALNKDGSGEYASWISRASTQAVEKWCREEAAKALGSAYVKVDHWQSTEYVSARQKLGVADGETVTGMTNYPPRKAKEIIKHQKALAQGGLHGSLFQLLYGFS